MKNASNGARVVAIANKIADRMAITGKDRIALARRGLKLLESVPEGSGSKAEFGKAAERIREEIRKEYGNPETRMEAAAVGTRLKSFAKRLPLDSLCLA